MAIATLAEVKSYLGITDTAKDTQITALLPQLQDEIIGECGSHFETTIIDNDNAEWSGGDTISFTASTKTIADSDSGMPFSAGQNIFISGTRYNDGHYTISTASASALVVTEDLIDEAAIDGRSTVIKLVLFPKALKMIMADYISAKTSGKEIGVSSESISGAVSTSYFEDGAGMPAGIKRALAKYKVLGVD